MATYKFGKDDLMVNILRTHPEYEVIIAANKYYINNRNEHIPRVVDGVDVLERNVPQGHISLYELNINRLIDNGTGDKPWETATSIFPFVTKDGTGGSFKTISTSQYSTDFSYGNVIKSKYPLSASFSKIFIPKVPGERDNKKFIYALENTLNEYTHMSPHYQFSSSLGVKLEQEMSIITIPSIFYGSEIKPGSISLDIYLTGSHKARLQDINRNGELIETTGSNVGKVAGVALYNEGFFVLTGSWDIDPEHLEKYADQSPDQTPKWRHFGQGLPSTGQDAAAPAGGEFGDALKTSFSFKFKGTNKIPTMTMFAHAKKNELNYSNNPTFVQKTSRQADSIKESVYEQDERVIKNITKSPFANEEAKFEKETYISKIGIYDEHYNLLGVATLATPVRKTEDRDFTFKLKLDF
tara:strand:- start:17644 stop:18876 length:1233 start_codon:yes stop_codon:yes gene_type:complete